MAPSLLGVGIKPGYLDREDLQTALGARYVVPDFQRGYAWTPAQLEDFTGDLGDHYLSVKGRRKPDSYFFGAIITIRRSTGLGRTDWTLEVIDGQQRLTTFFLTVAAIRHAASEAQTSATSSGGPPLRGASKLIREMETYLYEAAPTPRLVPGGVDEAFYRGLLEDGPSVPVKAGSPESHFRLKAAAEAIRDDLISKVLEDCTTDLERIRALDSFATTLLSGCYVIHAGSEDEVDAYRLFLVLNDRGLDLTEAELLKTRTLDFLRLHPARAQVAADWKLITERKPEIQRAFLRAYWSMREGTRPRSKDLHRQYQDKWFAVRPRNSVDADVMADVVANMAEAFRRHRMIAEGEWPYTPTTQSEWVKDRLVRLVKVLGSDASIPLLMALSYGPERRFVAAVLFLERYIFRFNISGGHKSSLGDRLFRQAKAAHEDPSWAIGALETELMPLTAKYADDARFKLAIESLTYRGSRILVRHLLTTLDAYAGWVARGAKGIPKPTTLTVFDLKEGDIDHIYPTKPEPGEEDTKLDPVRNLLGNLAFLDKSDNRGAHNKPFKTKQTLVYQHSPAVLTKDLADRKRWKAWALADYKRRRDQLSAMSAKVFDFPTS